MVRQYTPYTRRISTIFSPLERTAIIVWWSGRQWIGVVCLAILFFVFECILRKNGIQTESENSCVIFDDTTLEKTGRKLEHITKVFDHVRMNYVLGYKLLLCLFFDGKSSLPFDFSLHEELGKKEDGGLGKKALRSRFSKRRMKESPAYWAESRVRYEQDGLRHKDAPAHVEEWYHPHYALADRLVCLREVHWGSQESRQRSYTLHRSCKDGKDKVLCGEQATQCRWARSNVYKTYQMLPEVQVSVHWVEGMSGEYTCQDIPD